MPVTLTTPLTKGKGAEVRKQIRALENIGKTTGGIQYRTNTGAQAELTLATATDRVIGNDGTKPIWVSVATATLFQTPFASQADMEAATATAVAVSPETVQFHPGIAKAWAFFGTASATGFITGYNVSEVERTSAGNYTVKFTQAFSSTNYGFWCNAQQDVGTLLIFAGMNATGPNGMLASSFDMILVNSAGAVADPDFMTAFFFGDQ